MVDFQTTSSPVGKRIDTRWRASKHGQDVARPAQLDPTTLTSGTHYPTSGSNANIVPSGLAVGAITASGLYGPYDADAEDGHEVLAGYVNDNEGVELGETPSSAKPTFALLVHGFIKASLLPIAAQRTAVKTATTTGSFIYVED